MYFRFRKLVKSQNHKAMKGTNLLSEKIRSTREGLGYSQEYVADLMKISQQMYSKIEKYPEKTSVERLKQLALIFQIHVGFLLTDNDTHNINEANIDSLNVSDSLTIETVMEIHNRSLEKIAKDISELKGRLGIDRLNSKNK